MELASRIVAILFPLFAIVAIAIVVGAWQKPDLTTANRLNMDLFVPALVFHTLASKPIYWRNAERYHQDPTKVASMVLIGNAAAVVVLPLALAVVLPWTDPLSDNTFFLKLGRN